MFFANNSKRHPTLTHPPTNVIWRYLNLKSICEWPLTVICSNSDMLVLMSTCEINDGKIKNKHLDGTTSETQSFLYHEMLIFLITDHYFTCRH